MEKTASFVSLIFIFLLAGCATRSSSDAEWKSSVQELERKFKKNQRQMVELREKYMVLESLLAIEKEKNRPEVAPVTVPVEGKKLPVVQTSAESELPQAQSFQNEHYMYAKVIESYRKQDSAILQRVVELFLKSFPTSVHADNALFLLGQNYLRQRQLKAALDAFGRLERSYPLANKRPAAQLAHALVLKQLNRIPEARHRLEQVVEVFPGSREAFLAKTELQLLRAGG